MGTFVRLFAILILLMSFEVFAQTSPQGISLQGKISDSGNVPLEAASVTFNLQVLSPGAEECLLYEETHIINMTGSGGIFSLPLGAGTRAGVSFEDTSTLGQVFNNAGSIMNSLTCTVGNSYTPGANAKRKVKMTFDDGGGPQVVTTNLDVQAVPFALYADRLQGKVPSDFLQTSALTTQTKIDNLAATANYNELLALIAGTSSNYTRANGSNFTPAADVDFNGKKIINLATPTLGSDAVTKTYTDTKFGGATFDQTGLANGQSIRWNSGATKWEVYTPSTADATKLPLAGGTMGGAIDMGSNNLLNVGHVTMSTQKTLHLGAYTDAQETTLVSGLAAGDEGKIWYNSDANRTKIWTGAAPALVQLTAGDIGTAAGKLMGADAVPNCLSTQKLQMSAGPVYSWSCVADNSGQWTTTGSDIYYNTGNVGIGTIAPSSVLSVNPTQYSTGTASQSGTTITGVGTTFASSTMLGSQFVFADGTNAGTITAVTNATTLTVSTSQTVASQAYNISYNSLNVASTGKVGIGTATPASTLDVAGNGSSTDFRISRLGNAAAYLSISSRGGAFNQSNFTIDGTAALSLGSSGAAIGAYSGGTTAIPSNSLIVSGSVGVGTATPAAKLEVAGNIKIGDSGAVTCDGTTIGSQRYNSTSNKMEFCNGTAWGLIGVSSGGTVTTVTANAPLSVTNGSTTPDLSISDATTGAKGVMQVGTGLSVSSGTVSVVSSTASGDLVNNNDVPNCAVGEKLSMSAGPVYSWTCVAEQWVRSTNDISYTVGKVGIGTTSPQSMLHIQNAAPRITLFDSDVAIGVANPAWGIRAQDNLGSGTGGLLIQTTTDHSAYTDRVAISNTGKVGIGTITPSAILEVVGGRPIFSHDDGNHNLQFTAPGANGGSWSMGVSDDTNGIGGGRKFFLTPDINDSIASVFTVLPIGNIGMGTNSPTTGVRLDIVGSTAADSSIIIPRATVANRPTTGVNGMIRYASDTNKFEAYENGAWTNIIGTASSLSAGNGAVGTPSISFSGDPNTGFYSNGADTIGISTNGANVFNISSTTLSSPTTGGALITSGNGTVGAPTFSFAGDPDTGWWRPAADTMAASTAGAERVRIDSSGNTHVGAPAGAASGGRTQISPSASGGPGEIQNFTNTNANPYWALGRDVLCIAGTAGCAQSALAFGPGNATSIDTAGAAVGYPAASAIGLYTSNGTKLAERVRVNGSGQVGIGVTTPSAGLDVGNSAGSTVALFRRDATNKPVSIIAAGTGSQSDVGFNIYENVGYKYNNTDYAASIRYDANGDFQFMTAPSGTAAAAATLTSRMTILNAGNVGIGLTNPGQKLEVTGNTKVNGNLFMSGGTIQMQDSAASISGTNTGAGSGLNIIGGANASSYLDLQSTSANGTASYIRLLVGNNGATEAMRVTNSGNIGIGVTSPTNAGLISNKQVGATFALFGQSTSNALGIIGGAGGGDVGTSYNTYYNGGWKSVGAGYSGYTAYDPVGGDYYIYTSSSSAGAADASVTTLTNRLFISELGNVGIGTTSPETRLVVSNNSATLPASPGETVAKFANSDGLRTRVEINSFGTFFPILNLRAARNTAAAPSATQSGDAIGYLSGWGYGASTYGTGASIGFIATQNYTDSASGGALNFSTTPNGTFSTPVERVRVDQDGNVGIGTTVPTQKLHVNGNVLADAYLYTSDARLKTNVHDIAGLELILGMRGVHFNWKKNGNPEYGLIAQEVERVAPDLVVTDPVSGLKSVKYGNLVAPLIEATKDLYGMCIGHEKKIADLERKLASVEEKNRELENRLNNMEQTLNEISKRIGR